MDFYANWIGGCGKMLINDSLDSEKTRGDVPSALDKRSPARRSVKMANSALNLGSQSSIRGLAHF